MIRPPLGIALAAAALSLTACAVDREAAARAEARDLAQVPPATPVGEPISCVQTRNIRDTDVHGDRVIDFEMNGGRVYRNTLPQSCPGLGFEERFAHRTTTAQLCSVDTITVLRTGGSVPGPTCALGEFQPIELADARDRDRN